MGSLMHAILHGSQTQRAPRTGRNALCTASEWFSLLRAHVCDVFGESVLLILAEGPGGFEVIVVEEGVGGVMHVPGVGVLQIRNAHQFEFQRLCLERVGS